METLQQNLARKWRSRHFDSIIGQPLPVKVLKNSLYLGQFFPVYLFSGQRGCGKTTTARVFSAAINCEQLSAFQKSPKTNPVPCMTCASCVALQRGAHPDYIEIDAASHTGVDNVRALIEAASFMPVMGRKKIYLIDEAHMLSKAAFNALLKIMEEPPDAVVFMLATTDPDKIIETVRSRCFQLFFRPVDQAVLVEHLEAVCASEKISYERAGLETIVRASEGSVRDALNLVDQTRFAGGKITKMSVQGVLGVLDDERILALLSIVLTKGPRDLLSFLQSASLEQYSADRLWQSLVALVRQVLWFKYGVEPSGVTSDKDQLKRIAAVCSWRRLHKALDSLYDAEQLFNKTSAQHAVLEMILLQLCMDDSDRGNDSGASGASGSPIMPAAAHVKAEPVNDEESEEEDVDDDEEEDEEQDVPLDDNASWQRFLMHLGQLDEPLLTSIFKQANIKSHDLSTHRLEVEFSKSHQFFGLVLDEARSLWEPLLRKAYAGLPVVLVSLFTGEEVAGQQARRQVEKKPDITPVAPAKQSHGSGSTQPHNKGVYPVLKQQRYDSRNQQRAASRPSAAYAHEPVLDVSDETVWKKAALVKRFFPGECREVRERA